MPNAAYLLSEERIGITHLNSFCDSQTTYQQLAPTTFGLNDDVVGCRISSSSKARSGE